MIRAAFFDIDGTLLSFQTHSMPASAAAAIQGLRAAGVRTFLATGRNGDSTRFLMDTGLFDGEILINGQLCELGGVCVHEEPISREDIEAAVLAAEQDKLTLGFLGGHTSFVSRVDGFVLAACEYAGMAVPEQRPAAQALDSHIYQIHCYGAPGTEDRLLARARGLTAVRWSPSFADVYPAGGGKDRGLEALCSHLGIACEECIAFGDGENDIPMLRRAGIGVAMGNAGAMVQAQADYISSSVDEDGIVRAIAHFDRLIHPKQP